LLDIVPSASIARLFGGLTMFNLYEIIRNAHGGHALDNLATQFSKGRVSMRLRSRRVSKPSLKYCRRERPRH
jgi:hypothetical protein